VGGGTTICYASGSGLPPPPFPHTQKWEPGGAACPTSFPALALRAGAGFSSPLQTKSIHPNSLGNLGELKTGTHRKLIPPHRPGGRTGRACCHERMDTSMILSLSAGQLRTSQWPRVSCWPQNPRLLRPATNEMVLLPHRTRGARSMDLSPSLQSTAVHLSKTKPARSTRCL